MVAGVVVGLLVGLIAGVVVAVVVMIAVAALVWRAATPLVLRMLGARPLAEGESARLENVVDGLCATFGSRPPNLWVLDDAVPNSCVVGTSPRQTWLVITSGLLASLDLVELEAVVAHELAHVRRDDVVLSSVATAVLGPLAWLSGNDRLTHRVLGTGREAAADGLAVSAVRYPPGLVRALDRMQEAPPPSADSLFDSRRWPMTRWLWIDPMVGTGRTADIVGELDATSVRSAVLAEL